MRAPPPPSPPPRDVGRHAHAAGLKRRAELRERRHFNGLGILSALLSLWKRRIHAHSLLAGLREQAPCGCPALQEPRVEILWVSRECLAPRLLALQVHGVFALQTVARPRRSYPGRILGGAAVNSLAIALEARQPAHRRCPHPAEHLLGAGSGQLPLQHIAVAAAMVALDTSAQAKVGTGATYTG